MYKTPFSLTSAEHWHFCFSEAKPILIFILTTARYVTLIVICATGKV